MPTHSASRPASGNDPRLERLTKICLALPQAEASTRTGQHWAFLVRTKKFAYYLNDHHGDGRIAMTCRAAPGEQSRIVRSAPERFFVPSYLGPRGWIGLWLDAGSVDWDEVDRLIVDSYLLAAPKRPAAMIG